MIGYFINLVKKEKFRRHFKSIEKYISHDKSFFFTGFQLLLTNPIPNKVYVEVGADSILACKINFESQDGQVIVGNNCFIGSSRIICRTKVEFEDFVFVAWDTYFYDHDSHSIDFRERQSDIRQQLIDYKNNQNFIINKNWEVVNSKPIKVCSNAWVGMNCIILKGVTIGEGAIVGAGSVVTKDVPAWTIVAGNPARVVKEIPFELRKK